MCSNECLEMHTTFFSDMMCIPNWIAVPKSASRQQRGPLCTLKLSLVLFQLVQLHEAERLRPNFSRVVRLHHEPARFFGCIKIAIIGSRLLYGSPAPTKVDTIFSFFVHGSRELSRTFCTSALTEASMAAAFDIRCQKIACLCVQVLMLSWTDNLDA